MLQKQQVAEANAGEKPAEATGETRRAAKAKLVKQQPRWKRWDSVGVLWKGLLKLLKKAGTLQQINFNWSKQQWGKRLFEKAGLQADAEGNMALT